MIHIKTVCICGAGTMGTGIAQITATAGFDTILFDLDKNVLQTAKEKIESGLQKLIDKQQVSFSEKEAIIHRLKFTDRIEDCKADLIIEAIVEKIDAKLSLFKQLVAINSDDCIFASNTSSLSITEIARSLNQNQNFIGLHFFNPAPLMKLVEVVKTNFNTDQLVQQILHFAEQLGKTPVLCKDAPGFIVNRVARPFYIEALRLLEQKKASLEDIDEIMEAQGFKLGPFKLMDLIGNDINYAVSCSVYEQLNKPDRLKPSFIQKEKVETGALGKKSGRGYYEY